MKISSGLMEGSGGGRRLWFGGASLLGFVGGGGAHGLFLGLGYLSSFLLFWFRLCSNPNPLLTLSMASQII